MPVYAADTSYGSVPGTGLLGGGGSMETSPLLEPDPEPVQHWRPLSKQQLEAAAGGPGWRKVRHYLVLTVWLACIVMFSVAVGIIVLSPRPSATCLRWWQKSLFYQLQADLYMETQAQGPQGATEVSEQLAHLRSLGIGALILEGVFHKGMSISNLTDAPTQIQLLLMESNKANLKVVMDLCEADLLELYAAAGHSDMPSNHSTPVQDALRFWLGQGVAGFLICDTDVAYSEEALLEWRGVLQEFSTRGEERIVMVKQTSDIPRPLNSSQSNVTLVNVVLRSILPNSRSPPSFQEVAEAIEKHLQIKEEDAWPSWTVGGEASHELKRLLFVLLITMPGSPAIQHDEDFERFQREFMSKNSPNKDIIRSYTYKNMDKTKRGNVALFNILSHSKAIEEALMYGSFTFLPFDASSNSSSNSTVSPSLSPPLLAFLRSWGCVHFLVLLNVGAEPHFLNPAWAPNLPESGVFVASSGLNRYGTTPLHAVEVHPHEAIVLKLFKPGRYS
ncbi:4F2 cell-surface antigen heavy chain [Oryzias latipes]|uniref:Si:dkey-202g17.3 n=1 Tax=Oryzias latipes TaxID=8090 RepID=H2LRB3_ORYLA|nr:4F2 cell-surface antigen heavy chain [Oryzias latipes]